SPGSIVAEQDHFRVVGSHTFATSGSFGTSVRIVDQDLRSTVAKGQARVFATEPVSPDAPRLLSLQRFGVHMHRTRLVLTFDAPMDAASATNRDHYLIVGRGRDGRLSTSDDVTIPIDRITYDPSART